MITLEFEPKGLRRLFRQGIEIPEQDTDDGRHRGVVMLIKGEPGTGKTTLALQIALTAMIAGSDNDAGTGQGERRYYSCEQTGDDLRSRAKAIAREMNEELKGLNAARIALQKEDKVNTHGDQGSPPALPPRDQDSGPAATARGSTGSPLDAIDFQTYFDGCDARTHQAADPYQHNYDLYNWIDEKITEIGKAARATVEKTVGSRCRCTAAGEFFPDIECQTAWIGGPLPPPQSTPEAPITVTVLDGVNLLYENERELLQLQRLMENLRLGSRLGIVIVDSAAGDHPVQEFMADIVVEMKGTADNEAHYLLHKLSITKARYQDVAVGWHQYKNSKAGIAVFPSIHYWTMQTGSAKEEWRFSLKSLAVRMEEEKAKTPTQDRDGLAPAPAPEHKPHRDCDLITQMIGGYLKPGSCTVLLGPRRTLKTELCLDFLRGQFDERGTDRSLLVSLLDNQGDILEQRRKLCRCFGKFPEGEHGADANAQTITFEACKNRDTDCSKCFRRVHAFHHRPGCITPDEFMHWLDAAYQMLAFKRFVFWDLTQMEGRFPLLASDCLFLPLLIDWLKNSRINAEAGADDKKEIASLFMGSPNTAIGRTASAIADNVIFTWRDRLRESTPGKARTAGETRGVAVYLDRRRGGSGHQAQKESPASAGRAPDETRRDAHGETVASDLWWFPDLPGKREPTLDGNKRDREVLVKAQSMIDKIQAMQGFDVGNPAGS